MSSVPRFFVLAAVLSVGISGRAAADCTPITALPFSITESGQYCLASDLVMRGDGDAITVDSQSPVRKVVTIDLSGHAMRAVDAPRSTGISVTGTEAIVRNGTLIGFLTGVRFNGSSGRIEDLNVQDSGLVGIYTYHSRPVIQRNRITGTGPLDHSDGGIGIEVWGTPFTIRDNDIIELRGSWGKGISAEGNWGPEKNGLIEHNRVEAQVVSPETVGIEAGGALVVNNRVIEMGIGIINFGGKCRDNLTYECTTPFQCSVDAGNNN
jgi:hypothetical protein